MTQVVAMTMMMVVMMMINHDDDADDHHAAEAWVLDTSYRHHRLVGPGKPTLSYPLSSHICGVSMVTDIVISYSSSLLVPGGIVRGVPI